MRNFILGLIVAVVAGGGGMLTWSRSDVWAAPGPQGADVTSEVAPALPQPAVISQIADVFSDSTSRATTTLNEPLIISTHELGAKYQGMLASLYKPGLPGLGVPRSYFTQSPFTKVKTSGSLAVGSITRSNSGLHVTAIGPPDDASLVVVVAFGDPELFTEWLLRAIVLATPRWNRLEQGRWLTDSLKRFGGTAETPDYHATMKVGGLEAGVMWIMIGVRARP